MLRVAKATEELGFDAFFRSDHYLSMGDGDGLPGPTDAWITLAGFARETSRIRLGTLMTCGHVPSPRLLAIEVANVDAMSGGRVEFGLGAGWFDDEHIAYGIPFPTSSNGSTGSRSSSRSSRASGRHPRDSGSPTPARTTHSPTVRRSPSRSNPVDHR